MKKSKVLITLCPILVFIIICTLYNVQKIKLSQDAIYTYDGVQNPIVQDMEAYKSSKKDEHGIKRKVTTYKLIFTIEGQDVNYYEQNEQYDKTIIGKPFEKGALIYSINGEYKSMEINKAKDELNLNDLSKGNDEDIKIYNEDFVKGNCILNMILWPIVFTILWLPTIIVVLIIKSRKKKV